MKASLIYRKAAKLIDDERCDFYGLALDYAGQPNPGGTDSPLQYSLETLFPELYHYWLLRTDATAKDVQVLALLFASAIAKACE